MVAVLERRATELRENVLHELSSDRLLDGLSVVVEPSAGAVTLTGMVDCYARRREAEEAAYRVYGVVMVENEIQIRADRVNGWRDRDMIAEAPHLLESHYLLRGKGIHATFANGIAILTGRVETLFEREEAERMIAILPNLRAIQNNIAVIPPKVDPNTLKIEIEEALERILGPTADQIKVTVSGKIVSLTGTVRTRPEQVACLNEAAKIRGVAEVRDFLMVVGSQ